MKGVGVVAGWVGLVGCGLLLGGEEFAGDRSDGDAEAAGWAVVGEDCGMREREGEILRLWGWKDQFVSSFAVSGWLECLPK